MVTVLSHRFEYRLDDSICTEHDRYGAITYLRAVLFLHEHGYQSIESSQLIIYCRFVITAAALSRLFDFFIFFFRSCRGTGDLERERDEDRQGAAGILHEPEPGERTVEEAAPEWPRI